MSLEISSLKGPLRCDVSEFCGRVRVPEWDLWQIAVVLALGELSGWSTELIAHFLKQQIGLSVDKPKLIWDMHLEWSSEMHVKIDDNSYHHQTRQTAGEILEELGIQPKSHIKSLSERPMPVRVRNNVDQQKSLR